MACRVCFAAGAQTSAKHHAVLETDAQLYEAEAALLAILVSGIGLAWLARTVRRRGLEVAWFVGAAFAARLTVVFAFPLLGSAGDDLRGDDDQLFQNQASHLSDLPLDHELWWDSVTGELHVALFAALMKFLGGPGGTPLRVVQAALASVAIVLIALAVQRVADRRVAIATGWFLALEPSNVLFTTILQKEALVLVGEGLLLVGLARTWTRRDLSGLWVAAVGILVALGTRTYIGVALTAAALLVVAHLLWVGMGSERRTYRPAAAGVIVALVLGITAAAALGSGLDRIQTLQEEQLGTNTNLQLEPVDFTTPGGFARALPRRMLEFAFRPFPWQAENASQLLGVFGTLVAWSLYALLAVGLWRARAQARRVAPFLYVAACLVVGYALSLANAGTGFRHRVHLVAVLVAAVAILFADRLPESLRERFVPATSRGGGAP